MAIKTTVKNTLITVGDTIKVHQQFKSGDKTQTQSFEGLVISIKGRENSKTFTVRKIASDGIGVEKIWPVNCPSVTKVELKRPGNTRRSKLYYLRNRLGKESLKVKKLKKK